MGFIQTLSGLVGAGGGAGGTNFSNPTAADIAAPTTPDAVTGAQKQATNSLASQQALLNALQQQGGLVAQQNALGQMQGLGSGIANAGGIQAQGAALNNQGQLVNQLQNANGLGVQQQALQGLAGVNAQQQGLANQYQNIAAGNGPNPAQTLMNQATGANVANQAALMAGQRGAGANVGLLARQAAMQGAATEQQAIGQNAALQSQQQLNALGAIGGQQQAEAATQQAYGNIGTNQLAAQQAGIQNQAAQGQALVAAQQAQQQQVAAQANAIANQQIGQTNAVSQANLANSGQLQGALGNYNSQQVSGQNSINSGNTQLANTTMQGQQSMLGGGLNSLGPAVMAAAPLLAAAKGGEVQKPALKMADGGAVFQPSSMFGQFLINQQGVAAPTAGASVTPGAPNEALSKGAGNAVKGAKNYFSSPDDPEGEMTPASTAGDIAPSSMSAPSGLNALTSGAGAMAAAKGGLAKTGGHVKAKSSSQKPVQRGDSLKNDKVPAMLSAGEIVIPRSITQGKNPERGAAQFVAQVLAKRKRK